METARIKTQSAIRAVAARGRTGPPGGGVITMTARAARPGWPGWLLLLASLLAGTAAAAVRLDIEGAPAALRDNIRAHVGELPLDDSAAGLRGQRRYRASARQSAVRRCYQPCTL